MANNTAITTANARAKQAASVNSRLAHNPRSQARTLQRIAVNDIQAKDTPPHVRAALMRAWVDIQEMILTLEGKGKPRPVTAKNDPAHSRKARKVVIEPYPAPVDEKHA